MYNGLKYVHLFILKPSIPNSKGISVKELSYFISVWIWNAALLENDSKKKKINNKQLKVYIHRFLLEVCSIHMWEGHS